MLSDETIDRLQALAASLSIDGDTWTIVKEDRDALLELLDELNEEDEVIEFPSFDFDGLDVETKAAVVRRSGNLFVSHATMFLGSLYSSGVQVVPALGQLMDDPDWEEPVGVVDSPDVPDGDSDGGDDLGGFIPDGEEPGEPVPDGGDMEPDIPTGPEGDHDPDNFIPDGGSGGDSGAPE
tara:strand:+ start:807 stop:1346 length:540 start_codon:yes stop_codon:yes gene_type:complete